jgi:hypothetical protein
MRLTLREALASDRLEDFVRQEEARCLPLRAPIWSAPSPCSSHSADQEIEHRVLLSTSSATARWKRLFSQIEVLSKPTNDFREPRLAGVIDLWALAD